MTEQEEKMMFAAFALAGIMAKGDTYTDWASKKAWDVAEQMMVNKPKEEENGNS